jgi:hypothetical protein
MFPRRLAIPLLAVVAAVLAVPAAAPAATGPYPTIRSISPKNIAVGQTLTLKGTHYRTGKKKNTVVFKRDGSRAIFVRATGVSASRITVVVPTKLLPFFKQTAGKPQPTRFRLRVLASRFGKSFTPDKLTPLVSPNAPSLPPLDTDGDGIPDTQDPDDDNDGLPDTLELTYGLNPKLADTDGDGVTDGFEYSSAKDLNSAAVPYPGKRPYPNPLDGTDAGKDFDGDGLTLHTEFEAWLYMGKPMPYTYSDGTQWSIGHAPELAYRDDQRDVDQDGLPNGAENPGPLLGPMNQQWWVQAFDGTNGPKETKYYGPDFLDTSMIDPDTDGDGIKDGADDQDHDGYPNWFEMERPAHWQCTYVSTAFPYSDVPSGSGDCAGLAHNQPLARVQPFNPCKPIHSLLCHAAWPFGYYYPGEDWDTPVVPGDPGTDPPANIPPTLIQ